MIYLLIFIILIIFFLFKNTLKDLFSSTKTLIGKDNYLFLINDSANELGVHNDNILYINDSYVDKYMLIKNKFLLIIIPNKSYIYKHLLDDKYNLQYRPAAQLCINKLENHVLDGYEILKNTKNTYYKTDTHINLYGNYLIYLNFIDKINNLFNLNIDKKIINILSRESILSSEKQGIGDLTWESNLGSLVLEEVNKKDIFYYSNDFDKIFNEYIINPDDKIRLLEFKENIITDITNNKIGSLIEWNILSSYILYTKNNINPSYKVLIFYDSMLCSVLGLYLILFDEVYLSKSAFNINLVNQINPDYVFEFRIERFIKD
jgi:hypothetical protein